MSAWAPIDAADPAFSLTLAVIEASPTPLLLLADDLCVVAASLSFCDAFEIDPLTTSGQAFVELGTGEWGGRPLRDLLNATASGTPQLVALELELERPERESRCLIIHARRLTHGDPVETRLLVAIEDVTRARADARAKDEAIERLAVLLQEVRHRIANSLQIVASVLLNNARRASSVEAQDSLADAHRRVMSVAALERQLSAAVDGDQGIDLRTYFTSLCENIADSLIGEQKAVALEVIGGCVVNPRVSVSLGLIVTELVINALKHAFPDGRTGRIEIGYQAEGPNWHLSVRDDGVGVPTDASSVRSGIGTGVVQALARQLRATVDITSAAPGTLVCVEHVQIALVADNADDAEVGVRTRPGATTIGRPAHGSIANR